MRSAKRLKELKETFDRIWERIWRPAPRLIPVRGLIMNNERRANLLLHDQAQHGFLHNGVRE